MVFCLIQNTPKRLIDSSTHQVAWAWDSTAFGLGDPVSSNNLTFNLRFPEQYYDVGTNQFYNHNRYYNPELGRYMEPDPIGLEGGLNPYAYAGSNPVMHIDSSGLSFMPSQGWGMMDDSALRNTQMHNTINNTWLIQQQLSFERTSSNFLNNLNTQTASNYSSTRDLLVMDFGRIPLGFGSNGAIYGAQVFPDRAGKTLSRQDVAGGLQTGGDVVIGAGVVCGFSVVCSPASPAIISVGGILNFTGTALDTELSTSQKIFSIAGGAIVGGKVAKEMLKDGFSPSRSRAAGEVSGYFFGNLPASYNEQCKNIQPPYRC